MSDSSGPQSRVKHRKGPGRPSVLETKGDPYLAKRAAEMRFLGCSWSQIASKIGVGRTTARRLVLMYQKESGGQIGKNAKPRVPNYDVIDIRENHSQHPTSSIESAILDKLPKTFQIFSSLLAEVREMDRKVR